MAAQRTSPLQKMCIRVRGAAALMLWVAAAASSGPPQCSAEAATEDAGAGEDGFGEYWQVVEKALMDGSTERRGLLTQGDILVRPFQVLRNAQADPDALWPNRQLVLEFAPGEWPASDRRLLLRALSDMQRETCVRFVRRTNQRDYLLLKHVGNSCASVVGFVRGAGAVPTFLGGLGCLRRGTVQHEMLHNLGIWHEHTRPDRDDYVRVQWQHIAQGRESNFLKRPVDSVRSLGLPYDYASVMHYRSVAFSEDGLPTLLPRDPAATSIMGQRVRFSRVDIAKLNTLYDCPPPYYRSENVYLDDELTRILTDK